MRLIAPLTSLRFFAAAAVAVLHLEGAFGYNNTQHVNFAPAITFFFVLSGFIMAHAYRSFPDRASVFDYYVTRIARLWPLHLVTATYFLLFIYFPGWNVAVPNLLLLQTWSMEVATAMSMNGVSWSISVEVFFYLMLPAVIATRRYWPLWLIGSVSVVAAGLAMASFAGEVEEQINGIHWLSFIHIGPPARFLEFLAGVLTAFFYQRHQAIKLPFWTWTVLEILTLASIPFIVQMHPHLTVMHSSLPSTLYTWYLICGSFPAMCLIVLCFAYGNGAISKLLSWPALVFLGNISFALYMTHQLVLVTWLVRGWAPNTWNPGALALISVQIMVISALSYLFVERPAKTLIVQSSKWLKERHQEQARNKGAIVALTPSEP